MRGIEDVGGRRSGRAAIAPGAGASRRPPSRTTSSRRYRDRGGAPPAIRPRQEGADPALQYGEGEGSDPKDLPTTSLPIEKLREVCRHGLPDPAQDRPYQVGLWDQLLSERGVRPSGSTLGPPGAPAIARGRLSLVLLRGGEAR